MRVDFQGLERMCFGAELTNPQSISTPCVVVVGEEGPGLTSRFLAWETGGRRHQASSWGTQEEERCGVRGKAWFGSHWV